MYTDDPERDFLWYSSKQEAWLQKRPVCDCCGEHIQDEKALHIEGKWICNACIEDYTEWIEED